MIYTEKETVFNELLDYFPLKIKSALGKISKRVVHNITEIRFRSGRPVSLTLNSENVYISKDGDICFLLQNGLLRISEDEMEQVFANICEHSVYAFAEQIKEGFISVKNGCRVGIAGTAVYDNNVLTGFKNISSLNFRIAAEYPDSAMSIVNNIKGGLIIAGPPSSGKTTLLRDVVRLVSYGIHTDRKRVALIDSRGEVAAVRGNVPTNDIGPLTDVITSCEKSKGVEIALRTLNPEIIAFDEISSIQEVKMLEQGFFSGVDIITTVHLSSLQEIHKRTAAVELIMRGIVENICFLSGFSNSPQIIKAEEIIDKSFNALANNKEFLVV